MEGTQTTTARIRERNSGQPCEGSCAGALRVEQMGRGKVTEKSRNSTDPEFQTPGGCVSGRGVCSCGEPCWCDGGSHECMNAGQGGAGSSPEGRHRKVDEVQRRIRKQKGVERQDFKAGGGLLKRTRDASTEDHIDTHRHT